MDHILLEGHNATYDDFSILITENNKFKLHLKESLLIKRDNQNSTETFTPILKSFLQNDISYCNVHIYVIGIIVFLTNYIILWKFR